MLIKEIKTKKHDLLKTIYKEKKSAARIAYLMFISNEFKKYEEKEIKKLKKRGRYGNI